MTTTTRDTLIERLRPLVSYSFTVDEDETSIDDMFCGDDGDDAESKRWIRDQLRHGNGWAWCRVLVTATFQGFRGFDSLGCVSYESEKDFREANVMDCMEAEALSDLAERILRSVGNLRAALAALGLTLDAV